ncbi:cation diffusion facilitator family transporter [Fusobacterium sp. IOR10]|uniref:cation diffusion facilitator family transporter n=1 Tax=Fusobacterium sp. IOR10 TaxID=2665157 RepID=UPI0013D7D8D7|nr:cation diffusion facilitator family transporter [Fusobacterium sp. IOR10]
MYKILDVREIRKDEEKYRKLDGDIPIIDDSLYIVLSENNEDIGYIVARVFPKKYILEKIFIKKSERYKSCGMKLLIFFIEHGIKKKKENIEYENNDIENFLKKANFRKINRNKLSLDIKKARKRKKDGEKVAIKSVFLNIFLAVIKIFGGIYGHSRALVADGINSLSDVFTSFGILLGIYFSNIPGDEEHPYGHEKIESVIGTVMGVIIILTSFEIARNALVNLLKKQINYQINLNIIWIAGISVVIKYMMYLNKLKVGKETNNIALIADARDSKSDSISSFSVIIGILLSYYISDIFDVLLTILVSILIFKEGVITILETSNSILDKQDDTFIKKIEEYIYKNTNIKNVHDIYMRRYGDKIFLSMHIRLDKNMTVYEAHSLTDSLSESIAIDFEEVKDVMIHIDCLID